MLFRSSPSPPQWRNSADLRAFARWERKVEVWALQMMKAFMPPSDAALMLFTPLSGEAELEKEHLDLNKVNSADGIKYISCGYPSRAVAAEVVVSEEEAVVGLRMTTRTFPGIQMNRFVNLQTDMRVSRKICLRSESAPLLCMIPTLVVTGCLTVHVSLEFDRARESLNSQSPDFKPSPPVAGSGNTNGIRDQVPLLRLHLRHLLRALRQWHLHLPPIDLPQKGITSETC